VKLPAHLLRTKVAQSAAEFAGTFNIAFGKTRLPPAGYQPEMMTPEGQSTAGGAQSMQHVRLVPRATGPNGESAGRANLVIGSATAIEKLAELRTFEALDEAHRRHFGGEAVQLDRAAYATFLLKLQGFFEAQGFLVTLVEPSGKSLPPAGRNALLTGFLLGLVVVALAVGGFFLFKK
jgi:hypothetical protein